jgi:Zn-dependent peptidase ImmA (M78 family)
MPSEIMRIFKKAKVYQLNLKELDNQNNSTASRLLDNFKLTKASNVINLAKTIRSLLKVDLQKQMSWKDMDEAIEAWRNVLTTCGIYIFKDAFYNNQYSGLSLYDENYPVIIINNSIPKSRQIFTIFHELGHLLFNAGGVDILQESFYDRFHSDYYAIEQKCNEFAGELLMPAAEFQENHPAFSEENLIKLANTFKVSREVVLRKYLKLNLITPKMYKSYSRKWVEEYLDSRRNKKNSDSGGDAYITKKVYLGGYYIGLAFSHYYQGKIDMETLADYLGLRAGNVTAFEGYVLR